MNEHTRLTDASLAPHPRYVVWELTLKCDLACRHCGSRAGRPREGEVTVEEAAEVVAQLRDAGTREVAFIGGEAYLHPRWLEIVAMTADAGIRCTMTTGGRAVSRDLAERAAGAGLAAMSVSIDGMEATHDRLRNLRGSWLAARQSLDNAAAAGITPYANTQWNRLNLPDVEDLGDVLLGHGVRAWQVQLTGPMGRASDEPDWLLQPWQMLDLVPRLAAFAERAAPELVVHAANNLGYFGPHERILRAAPWNGCKAGTYVLGIESNLDVKGCPSLPSEPYVGGNLRASSLAEIWQTQTLRFARDRGLDELWGRCASCYYADVCRGGCSWTAHTLLGRRGNLPFCHHRAEMLAREGRRECLVPVEAAPGRPFDFGRFVLVEEPIPSD